MLHLVPFVVLDLFFQLLNFFLQFLDAFLALEHFGVFGRILFLLFRGLLFLLLGTH
jgi:hypothetical protein